MAMMMLRRLCSWKHLLQSPKASISSASLWANVLPFRIYSSSPASSSSCPNTLKRCKVKRIPAPNTFHGRLLPSNLISLTCLEGRRLFKESLEDGRLENYFSLVGNFTHQSDVALCGPGTLAMVLNALEADPGRAWRGIWRWYSDDMLQCCETLEDMKIKGITFDQFVCLAECHGLKVESHRFNESSLENFKEAVEEASLKPKQHLVVSFSRQSLGQTGIGHFSPIAGYHRQSQMVLVLDVARFKYPSYWVPLEMLWKAMEPIDPDTNRPRGFIKLTDDG